MDRKLAGGPGSWGPCPEYTKLEETELTGRSKKLLYTLPIIGEEYYISFEFKPTASTIGSVIHFQKNGTIYPQAAWRYPEVIYNNKLSISTFVNDALRYDDDDLPGLNQWTGIEISQQQASKD